MAWLPDNTGLQYYPELKRNSTNEAVQMHMFVGFDDALGNYFAGMLLGFTSMTHVVEIEAG